MVQALERARAIAEDEFEWDEEAERLGAVHVETEDEDGWRHGSDPGAMLCDTAEDYCRTVVPDDYPSEDEARQRIEEDALSVEVRHGWQAPGAPSEDGPEEFKILLCTGGPACQIRGRMGRYNEPESAWLEFQDWFRPWTEWRGQDVPDDCEDVLLTYARCFYFGE